MNKPSTGPEWAAIQVSGDLADRLDPDDHRLHPVPEWSDEAFRAYELRRAVSRGERLVCVGPHQVFPLPPLKIP